MAKDKSILLDSKQVAELLGIKTPRYARETLIKAGVPYVRVGWKSVRFEYKDVMDYIKRRKYRMKLTGGGL